MDKPDKIFVGPQPERLPDGGALFHSGDAYLLATPERELASELAAIARKSLTYHSDESEYQDELCCDEGAAYHKSRVKEISAVLAKLDKG